MLEISIGEFAMLAVIDWVCVATQRGAYEYDASLHPAGHCGFSGSHNMQIVIAYDCQLVRCPCD